MANNNKPGEAQETPTVAHKYELVYPINFQGKDYNPKTVSQKELEFLAQFPPEQMPFLKVL
ncbi:hypothetical protein [Runella zeae]|uniref:hypothetical protein n=1 Tax=Runella zeae TaxID=94255 RepID=UPI000401C251|nr:hypothetical protein [Runella zeae]